MFYFNVMRGFYEVFYRFWSELNEARCKTLKIIYKPL